MSSGVPCAAPASARRHVLEPRQRIPISPRPGQTIDSLGRKTRLHVGWSQEQSAHTHEAIVLSGRDRVLACALACPSPYVYTSARGLLRPQCDRCARQGAQDRRVDGGAAVAPSVVLATTAPSEACTTEKRTPCSLLQARGRRRRAASPTQDPASTFGRQWLACPEPKRGTAGAQRPAIVGLPGDLDALTGRTRESHTFGCETVSLSSAKRRLCHTSSLRRRHVSPRHQNSKDGMLPCSYRRCTFSHSCESFRCVDPNEQVRVRCGSPSVTHARGATTHTWRWGFSFYGLEEKRASLWRPLAAQRCTQEHSTWLGRKHSVGKMGSPNKVIKTCCEGWHSERPRSLAAFSLRYCLLRSHSLRYAQTYPLVDWVGSGWCTRHLRRRQQTGTMMNLGVSVLGFHRNTKRLGGQSALACLWLPSGLSSCPCTGTRAIFVAADRLVASRAVSCIGALQITMCLHRRRWLVRSPLSWAGNGLVECQPNVLPTLWRKSSLSWLAFNVKLELSANRLNHLGDHVRTSNP
eukprot:scaffold4516_cov417-Prasinococcus_capsulatus_cf.AAC.20